MSVISPRLAKLIKITEFERLSSLIFWILEDLFVLVGS